MNEIIELLVLTSPSIDSLGFDLSDGISTARTNAVTYPCAHNWLLSSIPIHPEGII
jgi:hypothetical protein